MKQGHAKRAQPDDARAEAPARGGVLDTIRPAAARNLMGTDAVFGAMADALKTRCDELFDESAARYLDPDDLESRWWQCRNGNKQLVNVVLDLAFAGELFDDQRYADRAWRILDNLVEHDMIANGGKKGGMTPTGGREGWSSPLDAGPAAEMLALALNLLARRAERADTLRIGT